MGGSLQIAVGTQVLCTHIWTYYSVVKTWLHHCNSISLGRNISLHKYSVPPWSMALRIGARSAGCRGGIQNHSGPWVLKLFSRQRQVCKALEVGGGVFMGRYIYRRDKSRNKDRKERHKDQKKEGGNTRNSKIFSLYLYVFALTWSHLHHRSPCVIFLDRT